MQHTALPSGIWQSTYHYPSSGRQGVFVGTHYVRLYQEGRHVVFEGVAGVNKSYLLMRLTMEDDIATGSWQEQTEKEGYYEGAVYHGAVQLVASDNGARLIGKWVGFGKDMQVNDGPWELAHVGDGIPEVAVG